MHWHQDIDLSMVTYICKICHENLRTTENHLPKMPRKEVARKTSVTGNAFLQAIREKPEFVHDVTGGCFKKLFCHMMKANMI